jgi:tripartite-type tricarboxylate transporter receptor subunit TctC
MRVLVRGLLCLLVLTVASPGFAQSPAYPTKPVRVIVGFSPGGPTDVIARLVAQKLSERWNQQVYVENHAGAGGNIAAGLAAKSAPDGYLCVFGGFLLPRHGRACRIVARMERSAIRGWQGRCREVVPHRPAVPDCAIARPKGR